MLYIIVNKASKSGLGLKKLNELTKALNANHKVFEVFETSKKDGANTCVKNIKAVANPEKDTLVVLGGDGTMNEVSNALKDFKIPLAYFPTGSSNDLARSMKISADTSDFIERLKEKDAQEIDQGQAALSDTKRRLFNVSCGIGFDAAVCDNTDVSPLKKALNKIHLGKLIYVVTAVKMILSANLTDCTIKITDHNDQELTHSFHKLLFAVTMIHPYEGGGIKMIPDADYNDGLLDIMVVSDMARWRAFYLLPLAFLGKHTHSKYLHFYRCKKAEISVASPLCVHTDGEPCGYLQKIVLSTHKNSQKFL